MTYHYIDPAQKELVVTKSAHLSNTDIARTTRISSRVVRRTLELWRNEGKASRSHKGAAGRPRTLNSLDLAYLEGLIEKAPDIYLSELCQALEEASGLDVNESTILRALRRRGYVRKHVSRVAREQTEEQCTEYLARIGAYSANMLVFLDESGCNRITGRCSMVWAVIGERARRHDYFVHGTKYSILPAICLAGIIHLDILTRPLNADEFCKYLDVLLDNMNPFPGPNSVLVMDNTGVHHFDGIRQIVEGRGHRLVYLLPYSPDFNPIEEGFSVLKVWIRRKRDYVYRELMGEPGCDPHEMLWGVVFATLTPGNIAGWFRDSGYVY